MSADAWREQARCKGVDTNIFFQVVSNDKDARARALCQVCPVNDQCAHFALTNHEDGVWAGESEIDRRRRGRREQTARRDQMLK